MWLWECELRRVGFRRRSSSYWLCEQGFGLPAHGHVSIFAGAECPVPGDQAAGLLLLEISAFHVTFRHGMDNLHFYYHEHAEGVWAPGGHTSSVEIRRYRLSPRRLREQADVIAREVAAALCHELVPRG